MAFRDALLEVEEIEQLALIDRLPPHHDPPPPLKASTKRNHDSPIITSDFFNSIDPKRASRAPLLFSRMWQKGNSWQLQTPIGFRMTQGRNCSGVGGQNMSRKFLLCSISTAALLASPA